MKISKLYDSNKPVISFEVFPPKTQEGIDNLLLEINKLKKVKPGFFSVTYGAGGSTQGRSLQLLERIIKEQKLDVLPHLTCIGSKPQSILNFLSKIEEWGVQSILALRGDYPKNIPGYVPESDFFQHASDLVQFIKANSDLDIAIAGFPEMHPEAKNLKDDIKFLKHKVDLGSSAIITQLFFNNDDYYRYIEKVQKSGINVPIIPGIWTLTSKVQVDKIPTLCNSKIPEKLYEVMNNKEYSDEDKKNIGIDYAVKQIEELSKAGVKGVHLYTLNKSEIVLKVLESVRF